MNQNTIAIIWDFDKTLIQGYMQDPVFKKFGISSSDFWNEVNSLPEKYKEKNIRINEETIYLNHMITCVNQGIFPNLNNEMLTELGKDLVFYSGIPSIFSALKEKIARNPDFRKFGIHVEHYIVSTGLTAMIKGSLIKDYVDGIWGCEFIETPIRSNLDAKVDGIDELGVINQIGYIIDNTSKTRAIFEINKGSNMFDHINVNSKINEIDRRVPFTNMIYVADGPSDVPVFSILKQYGGYTFAIYPRGDQSAFRQVDQLRKDGRVDMFAEADYTEGTTAFMWLMTQTESIANSIYRNHEEQIKKSASQPPRHLNEEQDN